LIRLLLHHGADVKFCGDREPFTCLGVAMWNKDLSTVDVLLDAGADPVRIVNHLNDLGPIAWRYPYQDKMMTLLQHSAYFRAPCWWIDVTDALDYADHRGQSAVKGLLITTLDAFANAFANADEDVTAECHEALLLEFSAGKTMLPMCSSSMTSFESRT
jgi:hypothetical protein